MDASVSGVTHDYVKQEYFSALSISDPFFDSLKQSYSDFEIWFRRKAATGDRAWVAFGPSGLVGFLYLKEEEGDEEGVVPRLTGRRLKIGTFKVDFNHHTGLGKRLLAIALRAFALGRYGLAYLTAHEDCNTDALCKLVMRYGFVRFGRKGGESVFVKKRSSCCSGNPYYDFPLIQIDSGDARFLPIYPEHHFKLFADTGIATESRLTRVDEVKLNSIEKVYLTRDPGAQTLKMGDKLVVYRTSDKKGPARFRSIVSAICQVTRVDAAARFQSPDKFLAFLKGRTVFTDMELERAWSSNSPVWAISFLYNIPFHRYPTRGELLEEGILYEGKVELSRSIEGDHVRRIVDLGEVREGYIID